ncbi:hypothetical protein [Streptomyces sirii]
MTRKTVADWRQIEAPVGLGDLEVTRSNRSLVAYVMARQGIATAL